MPNRTICIVLLALAAVQAQPGKRSDQFTPVVARTLTPDARPVPGTDGRTHLVYELLLTNTNVTTATLRKIQVLDGSDNAKVLAGFEGQELLSRLRTAGAAPVTSAEIESSATRIFLVDFSLDGNAAIPARLAHQLDVIGAASPSRTPSAPVPLSYPIAPLDISRQLPVIGPPVSGNHWVAINGCCEPGGAHRGTSLPVNGKIFFSQRFAIDWMRLDDNGRLVHGDASDVHNYTCYGADVLAIADGTVMEVVNNLDEQKPGTLPDPSTITIQNVDGNHVVLDLGGGVFALYAHLQKESIALPVGRQVKRGEVLGKLGNSGNTSGPHLHFQLMQGSPGLGSNGIPYVIDAFQFAGQISIAQFAAATGAEGDWSKALLPTPSTRQKQFPLDLNIVNFSAPR